MSKIRRRLEDRRNMQELRSMPDWQLKDIGISRVDLEHIVTDSEYRDDSLRDRWGK